MMHIRLMSLCVVFLVLISPLFAQEMQTFVSEDGSFTFEYPIGWRVEKIQGMGNSHLSIENFAAKEDLFSPQSIMVQMIFPAKYFALGSNAQTPQELAEQLVLTNTIGQPMTMDSITPAAEGTSQPLQLTPHSGPQITEFTVNGRPAAYGYAIAQMVIGDASTLNVVVDVGDDYWVTLSAASVSGGLAQVQKNEAAILNIAQSLRFTPPPPVLSDNPDLPRVFSGPVGIWQRGSVEFNYPKDWYVSSSMIVVFSNKEGNLLNVSPVSGQFIATVDGVSETRSTVDKTEIGNSCNRPGSAWTAKTIVAQLMSQIFPGQLEALTKAGISVTQPEIVTINGVEMVYFRQYQADYEVLGVFIDLGESNVLSMTAFAVRGEMATYEDQLFQVASTMRYTPAISDYCLTNTPEESGILLPTPQN